MSPYELIKQAILQKQIVVATYRGHRRELCPHVLGSKDGRAHCLFYQFGGGSKTKLGPPGSPDNWRCVFVSDLRQVEIMDGPWHTADNHSQNQTCVDHVDVQVVF
jgi:hypothetical protein